jgi:hypothetical protein
MEIDRSPPVNANMKGAREGSGQRFWAGLVWEPEREKREGVGFRFLKKFKTKLG